MFKARILAGPCCLQVLGGERQNVTLQALNSSDPQGAEPGHGGPLGLLPLMWRTMWATLIHYMWVTRF